MPHTKLYMRSKFLAYQSLTTQLLYTCMTTDHMTTDSNIFWLRHCSVCIFALYMLPDFYLLRLPVHEQRLS